MRDQIIQLLKERGDYFSGEEISHQLAISRAAIWKNIEELRKEGYTIAATPHVGYKLDGVPDKLIAREVQSELNTKTFGKKIIHFDSITSTMEHAFQLGVNGEEEGTVICAEKQTKGRGRMGRNWVSPPGTGIYASIILRPQLSPANVSQITLLSAVAVCEAILKVADLDVSIKWPNDILYQNKKVAGILTEMSAEMDRVRFIIVGIGINVNTPARLLPAQSASLKNGSRKNLSRITLFQSILKNFENEYQIMKQKGFEPVIGKWKKLSRTLGNKICINDMAEKIVGEAVGLDEFGGLIIKREDGRLIKKMSGDVVYINE